MANVPNFAISTKFKAHPGVLFILNTMVEVILFGNLSKRYLRGKGLVQTEDRKTNGDHDYDNY